MAYTSPITAVTGATFTAAQFNTSVRDNINALWVGTTAGDIDYYSSAVAKTRIGIGTAYQLLKTTGTVPAWETLANMTANAGVVAAQAAGDVFYATSATAMARLAKPSVDSYLKNTSSGTPSWVGANGIINATSIGLYNPNGQDITSTSYVDITNATSTITITKTCTILMMATGSIGSDSGNASVQPLIGGTAPAADGASTTADTNGIRPFTVLHRKTGVAAGTITCKLQGKTVSGHAYFSYGGTILLIAIEE